MGREMMRKWNLLVFITMLLLTGCGSGQASEPAPTVNVAAPDPDKVIAEASIEPARWSELRFKIGGTVTDVLVDPGDEVAAGDALVRLDDADQAMAVEEAKATLTSAQANLALVKAGPREQELAAAEADLEAAQGALSQAVARRDQVTTGATEAEIAAAKADLAQAEADYRQALRNRDQVYERYNVDTSKPRGYLRGEDDNEDRAVQNADYRLHAAREALAAAQTKLEALEDTSDERIREAETGVWAAAAQRDVAQAELDLLKADSPAWDLAAAEAQVQQAEANLAAAEAALARTTLNAPFDGTVTRVAAEVGNSVSPDAVVLVLAALDQLEIKTIDLNELDVGWVKIGQSATVTVDALPDEPLSGRVKKIGLRDVDYRGDVTYPVVIELEEMTPELRWGMTALVEIDAE